MDPALSRLPGVQPLLPADWLRRDEAFDAQLAYKDWLLSHRRRAVYQCQDGAKAAAQELLSTLVAECGFPRIGGSLMRPDGQLIALSKAPPLITAGRLTQEDWCIMQGYPAQQSGPAAHDLNTRETHILTAGVLCFPSSWQLGEKIGRGLGSIHSPVAQFDSKIARSVQRMFSAVRVGQPLWRANFLIYTDPDLHQHRAEGVAKPIEPTAPRFVRVERQTFRRLPKTRAVAFGIHSSIIPASSLSHSDHAGLALLKPDVIPQT